MSQDDFSVLTAICTHEACTVNGFSNSRFLCPCHGSQYSTAGAVLVGPATRSLQQFAASFSNGTLTFNA
jgi:cytochrome b6-f complex iron-sulfur subunit